MCGRATPLGIPTSWNCARQRYGKWCLAFPRNGDEQAIALNDRNCHAHSQWQPFVAVLRLRTSRFQGNLRERAVALLCQSMFGERSFA